MRADERPDPDALLARVAADETPPGRGRLRIFFGFSAGVGKTYAMLAAARELELKRGDVLVGYVEPHGRPETEALLLGLDIVPYRAVDYRGVALREFDLDEALRRRPKLVLVDELAHTNAPGSRHPKRWQDVAELLDAGIDVYTTLNVQHVESLNDVVERITGIAVRETVPDGVFDRASEVELVDLPPDELLERFREGKVYLPDQARRAADRFFRKESLVALRELALRKTAEHVNRQVELGRRGLAARPIWATRERLMVAIGPSPSSARLVRAARRMATDLRCPWCAVAVERPGAGAADPGVEANLRLAERLGGEAVTLQGDRVAQALIRFAHDRGVTRLVVGKTARPWLWRLTHGSIVDRVIRRSGDVDVLVMRGDDEGAPRRRASVDTDGRGAGSAGRAARDGAVVALATAGAFAIGLALRAAGISEASIVLVFLLGVAVVAYTASRAAAVGAAVLAMLVFNFFFTAPLYTFAVSDPGYLVTFGAMLIIGLVISGLVGSIRAHAEAARSRADANEVLYRISRRLGATAGSRQVASDLLTVAEELLGLDAVVHLSTTDRPALDESFGSRDLADDPRERAVAAWALERGREAGRDTDTLPDVRGWYLPLSGGDERRFGALGVRPRDGRPLARERRRLVRSVAAIAAQALEREALAERARRASIDAEAERLRSDLLATVSHDLRTPLSAISGAASAVLHSRGSTLAGIDRELLADISREAERLVRLVENLLELGRLDEGKLRPRADWRPVDEIVDAALRQVGRTADTSRVRVRPTDEPVLCWADESIATLVLVNLLDNALKYAPEGDVTVGARREPGGVRIEVLDSGPGFPGGSAVELFGRFKRGAGDAVAATRGSGLGLAICRAAALAHGGAIEAGDRPEGGARVAVFLPDPPGAGPPAPGED